MVGMAVQYDTRNDSAYGFQHRSEQTALGYRTSRSKTKFFLD